jgi:hypothetical protein
MFARQNKIYKKTIDDIRNIVVKPKLNLYYNLREEKIKEYRRAIKTLETKELKRENSRFHKRLKSSKSYLRLREREQDFKSNHQKLLDRTKKVNKRYMLLPPINSIMRKFESNSNNKYMRTERNDYLDKMKSTEPHFPTMKYNN